jgi:uncharacterized protein YqhQ
MSSQNRESSERKTPLRPYIGGQAVIEGVMMRSPGSISIVCRRRSGELMVRENPVVQQKRGARGWPLVRGVATLVESLRMGQQALRWSAELYERDALDANDDENSKPAKPRGGAMTTLALGIAAIATTSGDEPPGVVEGQKKGGLAMLLPIAFAVMLFIFLPQGAAELINRIFKLNLPITSAAYQAITGAAKLSIVVGYLLLIRRIPEVRRVFQYHGAEHKTISTYEAGEALEVVNARSKTTMHPRCGTTFLVMVALVSIVLFTILGALIPPLPGGRMAQFLGFFVLKLPFLPVIAAITFEIQRVFARYCTTGALRALLWPGFMVQKITTAEPDDAQLEVALASLRATLWREEAVNAPAQPDRVFSDYATLLADPGYAEA